MPSVVFQVVPEKNFISKFSDPSFWKVYKLYVLREITEGAMEVIRQHASQLWVKPTGALDQSWLSRIDQEKELGFIYNSKPYAYHLNYGVRAQKMSWLLNAHNAFYTKSGMKAAVIPIKQDNGSTLFRMITSRQVTDHPSTKPWFRKESPGLHFMEEGMNEYREHHLQNDYKGLTIKVLDLP